MRICILCGQFFVAAANLWDIIAFKNQDISRLCQNCQHKFVKLGKSRCLICDKNMEDNQICKDCSRWKGIYGQEKLLKNHAVYQYNVAFHDLMVRYKRYGDYCLCKVLQELVRSRLQKLNYDYYVPIPTSPEHYQKRQFDTITSIFQGLVPLSPLLMKQEGTGAQGERNREDRLQAKQGFLIAKKFAFRDNISKGRFLLLDDIYTTGRTLYHARDKLLEAFPEAQIESFSICH